MLLDKYNSVNTHTQNKDEANKHNKLMMSVNAPPKRVSIYNLSTFYTLGNMQTIGMAESLVLLLNVEIDN